MCGSRPGRCIESPPAVHEGGDVIEIEAAGIGVLHNSIVAAA